jgi:hypothetical protein
LETTRRARSGSGSVREKRLTGEAAADDLRIDLRIPFPGPHDLELVHPRLDPRRHDRVLHLLDPRQQRGIDLVETAAEAGQRANVRVDGLTTQVLEEVVMRVNAVQAGIARQRLVQVGKVILDEVRKWLRWVHARMLFCSVPAPWGALILSMVQ